MDIRRALTTGVIFVAIFIAVQYFTGLWSGKKDDKEAAATQMATYAAVTGTPHAGAMEDGATLDKIVLGDATAKGNDKVSLTIDPVTAGVDLVQLNVKDYAETVKGTEPLHLLEATAGLPKPYSTLGVHVTVGNTQEELPVGLGDFGMYDADPVKNDARAKKIHEANKTALYDLQYAWKVTKHDATEVDLLLTIEDSKSHPIAEITKVFQIDPASYNVLVSHRVKNLSDQPLHVAIDEMAATDLPHQQGPQDDRFFHGAALSTEKGIIEPNQYNGTHVDLFKLTTSSASIGQMADFSVGKDPYVWVAASNRFFVAITRPLPQVPGATYKLADGRAIPQPQHIAEVNVDVFKKAATALDSLYGVRLTGAPVALAANSSTTLPLTVFFGPKKRDLLEGKANAAPGTYLYDYDIFQYKKLIQYSRGGCYSFCTFDWLAIAILWLLDVLASTVAFHNYGVAIILLVVVIRFILHPLTRASQINMATMGQKMNKIKPLLEASKKRHPDDKKKQQEDQMRIYRENNVNPAGGILGCLPMLIQMPIWVAMYSGLFADLDLRHASFIPGWINDLSAPDAVVKFQPVTIPILSSLMGPISALNLLPLLLAVVFFFQMKVQMASQPKPADDQQAQMQNISKYMFFIVPLFLYSAPSGLNLYYFASTMAGLVDTYIVRKTLKKRGILPANAQDLPTHEQNDDLEEGTVRRRL